MREVFNRHGKAQIFSDEVEGGHQEQCRAGVSKRWSCSIVVDFPPMFSVGAAARLSPVRNVMSR
jgi:hypothetical protein